LDTNPECSQGGNMVSEAKARLTESGRADGALCWMGRLQGAQVTYK